jgi:hypothetical protein
MYIEFGTPLSKGWNRMKKALFQPFDLGKWFTIGFTAFLAGLADCSGNGGSGGGRHNGHFDWDEFLNFPQTAHEWLVSHPLYFTLIIIGVILVFIITVIFTWLSSRGKFMLLHNVVNNKAEVSKPWHEFKWEGNSLFLWRFVFGLLATGAIIFLFIYFFGEAKELRNNDAEGVVLALAILKMILMFIGYCIIIGYISLFLNDFIVPIMYKHRMSATKGWIKFLNIFWRHLGYFIVYGLFVFVLMIAIVICVIIAGICTCCIGFILLIIPYISAVVLLPITYTYRAFSVEFLEQFGEEYILFPKPEELANEKNEVSSL